MRDIISPARIALLHPNVIDIFTKFINDSENGLNITLRVVQGMRTFAQQQAIYDQGRTTPGAIISNAKPGSSFHNYGLAVDLAHLSNTIIDWHFDMSLLLPYMPEGMAWGGNFHSFQDRPHFEYSFGYTWEQLLEKYNNKDFIPNTVFLNI